MTARGEEKRKGNGLEWAASERERKVTEGMRRRKAAAGIGRGSGRKYSQK